MSNAYNGFIPPFSFINTANGFEAKGGHFWDGRADTLALQALGPFLASAEMNNPNAETVVRKVASSVYANQMQLEFGPTIFNNSELAFQKIGVAIAAFERTAGLQSFSSKYDAVIQGKTNFAPNESRGMALFMNPNKGNCASCHTMNPDSKNPQDNLFSQFTYFSLGIPRNNAIPQNSNPSFFDLGLCGPVRTRPALSANVPSNVSIEQFCGKFRMPSLRNVAQREAFMHNGFFKDLREVLAFYATRDVDPRRWYGNVAVPNDLPLAYQKNIVRDKHPFNLARGAAPAFTAAEADDMIAFLRTLSDGFLAPTSTTVTSVNPVITNNPISVTNPFGK
jgi:cytochrome c peroxidase